MHHIRRKIAYLKKVLPDIVPHALHHKSLLMTIGVFLFISISTILTLDQVQQRQITESQAQASVDNQPGGACDLSVNKGCGGAGGCRHWEYCNESSTCIDTTNGGTQPASSLACGEAAFSTVTPSPTRVVNNPIVTALPARISPTVYQTPTPTQHAQNIQYSQNSCYVRLGADVRTYPAGYCSPTSLGSPYLFCNNTQDISPSTSGNTYIGWVQDMSGVCQQDSRLCIGNGFAPSGGFGCCTGKTDASGKCFVESQTTAQPTSTLIPIQPTITISPTMTLVPSATFTPVPTFTPLPTNTPMPVTSGPTNTPIPLPTSTNTPSPTNTMTPTYTPTAIPPTSTKTPMPPTHTPAPLQEALPYRELNLTADNKFPCPVGTEINSSLRIFDGSSLLKSHQHVNKCIRPSVIIIHWSGEWNSRYITYETLFSKQIACQVGIDSEGVLAMQNFYSHSVERSSCTSTGYNAHAINIEITGSEFDDILAQQGHYYRENLEASTKKALKTTCILANQYDIPTANIIGHREIQQKPDPGRIYIQKYREWLQRGRGQGCNFDWFTLASNITATPIPPTSTPIPTSTLAPLPTSTPFFTSTPAPISTSAPTSQPTQFSTEPIRGMIGFVDGVYSEFKSTDTVTFVPVVYGGISDYFATNYSSLRQLYPQLYNQYADENNPNTRWMLSKNFSAMTKEDVESAWDMCPNDRCMFVDASKRTLSRSLFIHEATHLTQAAHAGRNMPRYMWGNGRNQKSLNRAYRSLQEGYAEFRAYEQGLVQVAEHGFVGGGDYLYYRTFYTNAKVNDLPSFILAREGYWTSFCDMIGEYKAKTGNSLSDMLYLAGWRVGTDETDSFSVDQCKSL